MTRAVFHSIVRQGNLNNRQRGVGGVISFENGQICQIIEGPDAAVRALYAYIEKDPRHSNVTLLSVRSIKNRFNMDVGLAIGGAMDLAARSQALAIHYHEVETDKSRDIYKSGQSIAFIMNEAGKARPRRSA